MQALREERSFGQLFKELRDETTTLLRQEVDLAKTEITEKASRAGKNVGSLAIGGGVAFLGALALLAAVIYGLTSLLNQFMSVGVAIWLAPLIVGAVLAAIGYGLVQKALAALRRESLTPQRTTQTLQENRAWLKARMQH